MSTLKPRTATIPIYQGDDAERLAELRMAVAVAERQAEQRKGEALRSGDAPDDEVRAAQDAYDAYVDEAAERAVEVVVRAIGRRRFRDLVAQHPPRMVKNSKGEEVVHDDDASYDVNVETFADALLRFAEPGDEGVRTIIAPEDAVKSPTALRDFLDDDVTDGDYDKIFTVAYWINRAPGSDPKELRYSPSINAISE